MNVKKILCILLVCVMVLSLCACGKENPVPSEDNTIHSDTTPKRPNPQPITVTDMVGRQVNIMPGSYQKVVCIGAGALRMYSYIGDMRLLAGVEDIDNTSLAERPAMFDSVARPYVLAYEDLLSTLPSCGVGGPMAQAAEVEKLLACGPDIVISEFEDAEKSDILQQQLGVPVITLSTDSRGVFGQGFADSIQLLGTIFAEEPTAADLLQFIDSEKNDIEKRIANIPEEDKPNVYICGLGNWGTTNHLMTAENYISFEIAGIKNVVNGLGMEGVGPIEEEKFVELGEKMDIIIMDAAAVKNIKPLYAEDKTMFDTCKAWNEGKVYLEMAYNAYYTNYEISLINTWFIAKTVYPEAFADVDMTEKTNTITKRFLDVELADEIFASPSSFGGYQKIDTETFFN